MILEMLFLANNQQDSWKLRTQELWAPKYTLRLMMAIPYLFSAWMTWGKEKIKIESERNTILKNLLMKQFSILEEKKWIFQDKVEQIKSQFLILEDNRLLWINWVNRKKNQRNFIGCDASEVFAKIAKQRLKLIKWFN